MLYRLDDSGLGEDANGNSRGCFRYIELENTENHNKAFAQVLDTCGAVVNSSELLMLIKSRSLLIQLRIFTAFTCHDLILTTDIFMHLAGGNAAKAMDDGQINSIINWKFVKEPCESCWTGEVSLIPSLLPLIELLIDFHHRLAVWKTT